MSKYKLDIVLGLGGLCHTCIQPFADICKDCIECRGTKHPCDYQDGCPFVERRCNHFEYDEEVSK